MQTMGSVRFVVQLTFIAVQSSGITRVLQRAVDTVRLYFGGSEMWLVFPMKAMLFVFMLEA